MKLIWNKGVVVDKKVSKPGQTSTQDSSASTQQNSNSDGISSTPEFTDSYVTANRYRGASGWASSLGATSAVIWNEDPNASAKSFRVKINSPSKDGISFDSGLIKDFAQNISVFVDGTICYVIYSSDFIAYSDDSGQQVKSQYQNAEAPRAESGDCPTDVFNGNSIKPTPITLSRQGVQVIYSDVLPNNSLKLRVNGNGFKSYQVVLESLLNSDKLWSSPIANSNTDNFQLLIPDLACDVRYGVRIRMWSEASGQGQKITDVRRHSFTSMPCSPQIPIATTNPSDGKPCNQVGNTSPVSEGYLECRRIVGDNNRWVIVDTKSKIKTYAGNSEKIEVCQIKDHRATLNLQTLNHSFPRPDRFKPSTGKVNIALVGIDFSDAPGTGKPFDQDPNLQKNFNEWASFYSGGKLNWNWYSLNEWIRVPGLSTQYNQKFSNQADFQMASEIFTALDPKLPLKDIPIILIIFPPQLQGTNNGYMPFKNANINISTGNYNPYYWGGDPIGNQYLSAYYYHEILHGIGFSLHAPSNGWFFGSTGVVNQFSSNFGYGAPGYIDLWSGFVNNWYDQKNIICLDKQNLKNVEVQLESIDVNPTGQIGTMVRLNDHEILVVESRRPSKYSIFPKGFYGVTVTKVDTSKLYARFDRSVDGFDWEQRQWSYYLRVKQQKSPEWMVQTQTPSRVLGYEGEEFEIDGVRIVVKKTGAFDTVQISRV